MFDMFARCTGSSEGERVVVLAIDNYDGIF